MARSDRYQHIFAEVLLPDFVFDMFLYDYSVDIIEELNDKIKNRQIQLIKNAKLSKKQKIIVDYILDGYNQNEITILQDRMLKKTTYNQSRVSIAKKTIIKNLKKQIKNDPELYNLIQERNNYIAEFNAIRNI